MNKLSALALGTALTLSLPFAGFAQDAAVDAGVDAGVEADAGAADANVDAGVDAGADAGADAGVDAGADANAEAGAGGEAGAGMAGEAGGAASTYTYGDLDAALQGAGTADLSGVTADTTIEIVDVSTLSDEGEFTADAFGDARTGYQGDIDTLQSNIEANADLMAAIEAEGHAVADVVAVWTQADDSLTVFVDGGGSAGAEGSAMPADNGDAGAAGADMGAEAGGETDAPADGEAATETEPTPTP